MIDGKFLRRVGGRQRNLAMFGAVKTSAQDVGTK